MGLGAKPLACEVCVIVVNGWEHSHTQTHTLMTHPMSLFSYLAFGRTGSVLTKHTPRPPVHARGGTCVFADKVHPRIHLVATGGIILDLQV